MTGEARMACTDPSCGELFAICCYFETDTGQWEFLDENRCPTCSSQGEMVDAGPIRKTTKQRKPA